MLSLSHSFNGLYSDRLVGTTLDFPPHHTPKQLTHHIPSNYEFALGRYPWLSNPFGPHISQPDPRWSKHSSFTNNLLSRCDPNLIQYRATPWLDGEILLQMTKTMLKSAECVRWNPTFSLWNQWNPYEICCWSVLWFSPFPPPPLWSVLHRNSVMQPRHPDDVINEPTGLEEIGSENEWYSIPPKVIKSVISWGKHQNMKYLIRFLWHSLWL